MPVELKWENVEVDPSWRAPEGSPEWANVDVQEASDEVRRFDPKPGVKYGGPSDNYINSVPYQGRQKCNYCGPVGLGCARKAKSSTDVTYWPEAVRQRR